MALMCCFASCSTAGQPAQTPLRTFLGGPHAALARSLQTKRPAMMYLTHLLLQADCKAESQLVQLSLAPCKAAEGGVTMRVQEIAGTVGSSRG